jgi:hypothetical protein
MIKAVNLKTRILTVVALTAAAAAPGFGSSIAITNPGFETPATLSSTTPNGWTVTDAGSYNPYEPGGGNAYYAGANPTSDPANGGSGYPGIGGENLAYVFKADGVLSQTLTATFQADTSYTLSIFELNRNGTSAAGWLGSEIELLAGSTVIASATDTVGPTAGTAQLQTVTLANSDAFSGLFGQHLSIVIEAAKPLTLSGQATDWDSVALTGTAVAPGAPEPGSAWLLLAAAAMAAFLKRRASGRLMPKAIRS